MTMVYIVWRYDVLLNGRLSLEKPPRFVGVWANELLVQEVVKNSNEFCDPQHKYEYSKTTVKTWV